MTKMVKGYEIKAGADLRNAKLHHTNLYEANLSGAELSGADLRGADLRYAKLCNAELIGADLCGADLRGADLRGANLYGVNLRGAKLSGADLRGVNLYGADLRGANLCDVNLCDVNLRNADLRGANLYGAKLDPAYIKQSQICPQVGGFYGYKKTTKGVVKLYIPAEAKRINAIGSWKCRASEVKVIDGEGLGGNGPIYGGLKYDKGAILKADNFDDDCLTECSEGIHFFLSYEEAEAFK